MLHASKAAACLVVFQGLDASGKDGITRRVFTGVNPRACEIRAFRAPNEEELLHDYMWRHEMAMPARGKIGVWDRSHYEEIGVVRVHVDRLKARNIEPAKACQDFWRGRVKEIKNWERAKVRNGTTIVKFFLNVSAAEQGRRFQKRLTDPEKHWKLSTSDLTERAYRSQYLRIYSEALHATSTRHAPWYVIPSDDKLGAALVVSRIINHHLGRLSLKFPGLPSGLDFGALEDEIRQVPKLPVQFTFPSAENPDQQ